LTSESKKAQSTLRNSTSIKRDGNTKKRKRLLGLKKQDYDDDDEGAEHFSEAETDSACFVVVHWGLNGEEDE